METVVIRHADQSGKSVSWHSDTSGLSLERRSFFSDLQRRVVSVASDGRYEVVDRDRLIGDTPPLFQEQQRERFFLLASLWRRERQRGADVHIQAKHPAYRAIIGMGDAAIPFILIEMRREPVFWFPALYEITKADPVPESKYGIIAEMKRCWIQWGKDHGYTW